MLPEHGIFYPQQLTSLPVRDLLRLSQTDETPDAAKGLRYAAAAFDIGTRSTADKDLTVAGEAAAKAYLRSEQLGLPESECEAWLTRSFQALEGEDPRLHRERIATLLLSGRGHSLHVLRGFVEGQPPTEAAEIRIIDTFAQAETVLRKLKDRRDPYGTMLDRHRATAEAVLPITSDAVLASRLAIRGIFRAVTSRRETANAPGNPGTHLSFIAKQVSMNAIALGLAITKRPATRSPQLSALRLKTALHLLG